MNKITKISLIAGISGLSGGIVLFLLTHCELYLLCTTVCMLFCFQILLLYMGNKEKLLHITGKDICKHIINATITSSYILGVLYLLSNTTVLTFLNNKLLNFVVVWTVALLILGFINFAVDYLFGKLRKKEQ